MKFGYYDGLLARRYAQAFFRAYGEQITAQEYDQIVLAEQFFLENKQFATFFLGVTVSEKDLQSCAQLIVQKALLPDSFLSLVSLLLADGRVALLSKTLHHIALLYCANSGILRVAIVTSCELQEDEIEIIKNFIASKTGKRIFVTVSIDPSLIAGIQVRGEQFLWEYSVTNQLQNITRLK